MFLSYKGLSEGNIGMVASIVPITGIICNPFWNHLAKDVNSNKKIMKWITIIEGIFFLIFIPLDRLELICIITCLIAIVGSPFYTLMDGFASTYVEQNNIPYAKMRIMGSLAYVFGTILGEFFY
ncbi:MAG: MFS transporter [Clostridium sp.]|nr:MAG: MFS transporter [Clostridium sp.]